MKAAMIVPHRCLHLTRGLGYHMILPQLVLDNEDYHDFYQAVDGFKIVDNGAAEGQPVSWDSLMHVADVVGADYVVAPDVLGEVEGTILLCRSFADVARHNEQVQFMGVIQGKSYSEMLKCFRYYMYEATWVNAIALPRLLCNIIHPTIRASFVEAFSNEIKGRFEFVHCLGASTSIKEAIVLRDYDVIKGIDTSLPAVLGIENLKIEDAPYHQRQMNFFNALVDPIQQTYIQHNIDTYCQWAR